MIDDWLGVLAWVLAAVAAVAGLSAFTWRSWRRFARQARGAVTTALPRTGPETELDALFAPLEADHPGRSGLLALLDNPDAYAARALSARMAGRSLDLMYYIWRTDLTGWLLIEELLAAADRGVRVRLLLDDVNVQGFDRAFLALNQHPNVEVRLFNPIRNRGHVLRRTLEMLLGLSRFNRRMHNKAWIADGRLAIVGGRNIGDTYYDAEESGLAMSRDADVMLAGPVVAEVEGLFDSYWNLGLALPILTLWPEFKVNVRSFQRRMMRHNRAPEAVSFLRRTMAGRDGPTLLTARLRWTDKVTLLADPPDKAMGQRSGPWMGEAITALLRAAEREVRLITPYFVPGNDGCDLLTELAQRGVRLSIMTNALSVTDMVLVHGAYRHYRLPLLKAGAELYEFGPPAAPLRTTRPAAHQGLPDRRAAGGGGVAELRPALGLHEHGAGRALRGTRSLCRARGDVRPPERARRGAPPVAREGPAALVGDRGGTRRPRPVRAGLAPRAAGRLLGGGASADPELPLRLASEGVVNRPPFKNIRG